MAIDECSAFTVGEQDRLSSFRVAFLLVVQPAKCWPALAVVSRGEKDVPRDYGARVDLRKRE